MIACFLKGRESRFLVQTLPRKALRVQKARRSHSGTSKIEYISRVRSEAQNHTPELPKSGQSDKWMSEHVLRAASSRPPTRSGFLWEHSFLRSVFCSEKQNGE